MLIGMSQDPLKPLWQPATMACRAAAVLKAAQEGNSPHFRINLTALTHWVHERLRPSMAQASAPLVDVPRPWAQQAPSDAARSAADFAVVASLLSAHPGPAWSFDPTQQDPLAMPQHRQTSDDLLALLNAASTPAASPSVAPSPTPSSVAPQVPAQNEALRWSGARGMLRATAQAFDAGAFSSDPHRPWRADARALLQLDTAALRAMFQAGPANAWVGLEGRTALLRGWADVIAHTPGSTATDGDARASEPFRAALSGEEPPPSAQWVLDTVMRLWARAHPNANRVLGLPAGDVWPHRWAGCDIGAPGQTDWGTSGMMPLHHQALVMVQALGEVIAQVHGVRAPECVLPPATDASAVQAMLDAGALQPRHAGDMQRTWQPQDEWAVEARALSMALWNLAAEQLRASVSPDEGRALPVRTLQSAYAAAYPSSSESAAIVVLSGQGVYF